MCPTNKAEHKLELAHEIQLDFLASLTQLKSSIQNTVLGPCALCNFQQVVNFNRFHILCNNLDKNSDTLKNFNKIEHFLVQLPNKVLQIWLQLKVYTHRQFSCRISSLLTSNIFIIRISLVQVPTNTFSYQQDYVIHLTLGHWFEHPPSLRSGPFLGFCMKQYLISRKES